MAYYPFRHLGLKVLAIALATLLWLTVAGEHIVERSMRVPLEFRNMPQLLEITGDPPATVDVRLRGSSAILSRLDPGEVVAVLDLGQARPGSRLMPIRNDEVRAPFGVEVAQVIPSTIPLQLEPSATRSVPVIPDIEGDPAPGFVIGRVTAEPATVVVQGPESRLRQLAEATTEPVSVAGRREQVHDVVNIGVSDPALRLSIAQNATVVVEIWPAPVERELESVQIHPRNLANGLRATLSPSSAKVTLRGRREAVSAVREDAIGAFVDLAGLGAGRYNLRVQIDPSENFGVSRITPSVVVVSIK